SVGEKDLIKEAIDYIGGKKLFWKIKIKPGSAMLCSEYQDVLIISLSGNPTAALTTFELVVATTLQKLAGKTKIEIKREKAILTSDYNKKSVQRRFVRGYTTISEQGQVVSVTQVKSGNGILSSALNSNCIIELEAGNEGVKAGELVNIIKF
ncbi:MAG: molybdopterin-binding protein, partial [Turicibacter sp.]